MLPSGLKFRSLMTGLFEEKLFTYELVKSDRIEVEWHLVIVKKLLTVIQYVHEVWKLNKSYL